MIAFVFLRHGGVQAIRNPTEQDIRSVEKSIEQELYIRVSACWWDIPTRMEILPA